VKTLIVIENFMH